MKQVSTLLKEEKEQNNSVALGRNRTAKVTWDDLPKSQGSATSPPDAVLCRGTPRPQVCSTILTQCLAQDLFTLVKTDRQKHSKQAEPYLRAGDWERKREEMLRLSVLSRLLHEPPTNFG